MSPQSYTKAQVVARYRIGVCSWSLEPVGVGSLIDQVRSIEGPIDGIQLALDPVRADPKREEWGQELQAGGISILSGMMAMAGEDYSTPATIKATGGVVPDGSWSANRAAAAANADLARELGIGLVTFHAGFIPADQRDSARATLVDRLRTMADVFGARGVRIGLETGQEHADELLALLAELDHPSIGINFDPANMILYGMGDPVHALERLARHVIQVHIKDGLPPRREAEWGQEVRVGTGAVDWPAFFAVLDRIEHPLDLVVEREAGADRVADISAAVAFLGPVVR